MTSYPTWFGRWPAPTASPRITVAPAPTAVMADATPIKDIPFIKRPVVVVKRPTRPKGETL